MTKQKFNFWSLSFLLISLISCSNKSQGGTEAKIETAGLKVHLNQRGFETGGHFDLVITYPTGQVLTENYSFIDSVSGFEMQDLNPAENVTIQGHYFSQQNEIKYEGESLVDLRAGELTSLELLLKPTFVDLKGELFLGYNNPMGISSGKMTLVSPLDTLISPLTFNSAGNGEFALGEVFFGDNYLLEIKLFNDSGEVLFESTKEMNITDSLTGPLEIHLESLFGSLSLDLILNEVKVQKIQMFLPGAKKRKVNQVGELRFNEFMANPRSSGDDYEYIELWNLAFDTLDLVDCSIGRYSDSQSGSAYLKIEEGYPVIPPGEKWVLGRDSVEFADTHYTGLTLLNSGQSLVLQCEGIVIDSINYSDTPEQDFNVEVGKAFELNQSLMNQALEATAWCLGTESFPSTTDFERLGTPGFENVCP